MFAFRKLSLCRLGPNLQTLRTRRIKAVGNIKVDPGINKRKKVMSDPQDEFQTDFEDLETDFMDVHKTHREHMDEVEAMKEKLKYHIVRQKYFREKYPNFLTWNDMEQIKYLHSTNPEEWTVEKLSESFPALPEIIKKVLRAKYSKNERRIAHHDASVHRNWQQFKAGKIPNLPPDLVEHLKIFTNRNLDFKPFVIPKTEKEFTAKPNIPTDFSEIVTSYKALKNKSENPIKDTDMEVSVAMSKNDAYLMGKLKYSVTLKALQNRLEKREESGDVLTADEKLLMSTVKTSTERTEDAPKMSMGEITDITKYHTKNTGGVMRVTQKDYSHLVYPEKIDIPKNIFKHGSTYKLNDCYYDSDGRFLYRVPGMG